MLLNRLSSSLPALDAEKSLVDVDSLEDSPAGFRQTRRAAVAAASKAQPDKRLGLNRNHYLGNWLQLFVQWLTCS